MEDESNPAFENVMFRYTLNVSHLEEENRVLRDTVQKLRTDLDKFMEPALMVCEIHDLIGNNAVIRVPNGNMFYVNVAPECKSLKVGDLVVAEQKNLTVLKNIKSSKRFNVEKFVIIEKPSVSWDQIGGLESQINEVKEVIELPLVKPELFVKVGITPPKGVLLHGPPGTGKTLLAKAVAASTNSTFIELVGSELVQKFIGEGAKLVKEIFELARHKAPAVVFIDELDAIAAKRVDLGTSGEREVQRTFMQLLSEIDGFKPLDNVKIIGCTNRKDILDSAVMRPGRLDRLIKVPLPNEKGIERIFDIHSKNMSIGKINRKKVFELMKSMSGAEIKAVCTEAGYFAIREERTIVSGSDFMKAIEKIKQEDSEDGKDYIKMFG
ncbi:AAA family ATPase [Candidatus Woesearchaeota archaeon]|nr:AAA family ATPase [Candidatus Woesearchaeota archaeon]